ncbi:hypothetical protein TNCV_5047911 [Trichonephila clavipes]|nr:hypothetical protein TNCV_5047911 [Trichonephila clavipes]
MASVAMNDGSRMSVSFQRTSTYIGICRRDPTLSNSTPSLGELAGSITAVRWLLRNLHGSESALIRGLSIAVSQVYRWRGLQYVPSSKVSALGTPSLFL